MEEIDAFRRELDNLKFRVKDNLTNEYHLPIYDGNHYKLTDFLNSFEIFSRAHNLTQEEKAAKIGLFLKDSALELYLSFDDGIKNNYNNVVEELKRRILTDDTTKLMSREFRTRRQAYNEPVSNYSFELKKLSKRAFPNLTDPQREPILIDQFIFGLKEDLQNKLLDTDPANFDEAVNKARSIEFRSSFLKTHNSVPKNDDLLERINFWKNKFTMRIEHV